MVMEAVQEWRQEKGMLRVGKAVFTEKLLNHSQLLEAAFLHVVGHVHYSPGSWE